MVSLAKGYSTTKILTLLLLATLLGLGSALILHWKYGGEEPEPDQHDLEAFPILSTDKNRYYVGEPIQATMAILNNESVKVELRGVEYDFTIHHLEQEIYIVKVHFEFPEPILLDPNSTYQIPITHTWDQRDNTTDQQVLEGTYVLKVQLLPYNLTTTTSIVIEK